MFGVNRGNDIIQTKVFHGIFEHDFIALHENVLGAVSEIRMCDKAADLPNPPSLFP
jgi:hypothetical protein